MDINNDELRRELRDLDQEHRDVMPKWRDSLMRLLVDDKETPTEDKADFILGGFNRRRFMRLSGLAVVGGTVLAACGSDKKKDSGATTDNTAAATTATTAASAASKTDQTIARTAASLENFAVAVYDKAIMNAAALKISDPVAKAAVLFKAQHKEHADAFNGAATQLGGQPYTDPNPTAAKAFEAQIAALKTEQDVLKFAFALEQIAAQTYQGVGMKLSTPMLRQTAMTVGGVEARQHGDPGPLHPAADGRPREGVPAHRKGRRLDVLRL